MRDSHQSSRLMRGFAVAVLFFGTGAFFVVFGAGAAGKSQPAVLGLWVLAYAIAGLVLLDGLLRERRSVCLPPELVIFLGLAAASTAWSQAPALAARRSFGLAGTVLVALLLAQRLKPLEILNALLRAMLLVALVSLGLYAVGSDAVIDVTHGTLRGVVATKNSLGFFMALGLLACAALCLLEPQQRGRRLLAALPIAVALSLTDSKSALVIVAAIVGGTLVVLLRTTYRGATAIAALTCLVLAVTVVILPGASLEGTAALFGEDTTLTGRDAVWEESLVAAESRPVLGYGYGAFWDGTEAANQIRARLLWAVPTAHNGVIEVWLDLGIVGVLTALAIVVGLFARGWGDLRAGRKRSAALKLPIAVLLVTSNIVESNFLVQNSVLALLVVAAVTMRQPEYVSEYKDECEGISVPDRRKQEVGIRRPPMSAVALEAQRAGPARPAA